VADGQEEISPSSSGGGSAITTYAAATNDLSLASDGQGSMRATLESRSNEGFLIA
jgi:hypothetical protein